MTKMQRTLVNIDLSQAELRVMALLSNDEWMINALQEGAGDFFDSHLMPVAFPMLIGPDGKYATADEYKQADPVQHKEDRTKVKAVQYGLAFGRQAPAIAESLKLPTWVAQTIIDNYMATATGFAQWREDIKEAARIPAKRDLLINPFGRRFQSEVVTTKNYRNIEREALSFLPQSTSSDIMLATCVRIAPTLLEAGYTPINVVHDALMLEGPDDPERVAMVAEFVGRELRATGEAVLGPRVPFLSDWSFSTSWAGLS